MRFSRYVVDNEDLQEFPLYSTHLSAQEAALLSLTDIRRISVPPIASKLLRTSAQRFPALYGLAALLIITWRW